MKTILLAGLPVAIFLTMGTASAEVKPGRSIHDCRDCPEMIQIPPGKFTMGALQPEEEAEGVPAGQQGKSAPLHEVTIKQAFAIGKTHVTRGQFAAFVKATGYQAGDSCTAPQLAPGRLSSADQQGRTWRDPGFPQTDDHPVVCVSVVDAKAYIDWLSKKTGHRYRLPTEAEWEYAARAGSQAARYYGDDRGAVCAYANTADDTQATTLGLKPGFPRAGCEDGYAYTSPVGKYQPNAFGLYDMLGNVWQLQEDCWNESYQGAPTDGSAWTSGDCSKRAGRGGAWDVNPRFVRSASRVAPATTLRLASFGFRVVRTQ